MTTRSRSVADDQNHNLRSKENIQGASSSTNKNIAVDHQEIIIDRRTDSKGNNLEYRYIKGKLLGKGGFAKCYVGTSERSKTNYAIKLVQKSSLVKQRAKLKVN